MLDEKCKDCEHMESCEKFDCELDVAINKAEPIINLFDVFMSTMAEGESPLTMYITSKMIIANLDEYSAFIGQDYTEVQRKAITLSAQE